MSDARARRRALPPDRRAQLLDPAEAEFAAHGFEGASLNRILAAASMSKGQAYYYIDDKADLYVAVIDRALDRLAASLAFELRPPRDADDYWRQVADLFARVSLAFVAEPGLAELARGVHDAEAALAGPRVRLRDALHGLVAAGQPVGAVRADVPTDLLVEAVFGAARGIDRWFADHWPELPPEAALHHGEQAVGLIRALCAPPKETP